MKKNILFLLANILFLQICFSQQKVNQSNDVNNLFADTPEIYFSFTVTSKEEISIVTRIVSIDNVKNNQVFAYANKKEFKEFVKLAYDYKLLPHPGKNPNALMCNDYSNKQTLAWDVYPTYSAYESLMAQFQADYPNLCDIDTIASLSSNRRILVAKISKNVHTSENEPQFLYSSTMHGDETTGYVTLLRLIDYLLTNYGTNATVTNLLDNIEIWICPNANPNGTYFGGNSTVANAIRYNANFVDLNRNYADPQAGAHPDGNSYQAETQGFITFAQNHHFNMAANFHGGAEVVNYPWDTWTKASPDNHPHPDDNWWMLVSNQYADSVQAFGPANYFTDVTSSGISEGGDWYTITGGRQDYMTYFQHCRETTIEISSNKNPPAATLPIYWNANYRSLLNFMKQSLNGVRGLVIDSCSGTPIVAKVFISGHDFDSSHVYSALPFGNYHRYLYAGNYNITFSAPGYQSKTINAVNVVNNSATVLNIPLKQLSINANFAYVVNNSLVSFTDQSSSAATTWNWDFGDGGTSTLQNPTHNYAAVGTYTVVLTISNGCISNSKTIMVTINAVGIIENASNETVLEIFPNPVNNSMSIQTMQNSLIEITNLQGQVIKLIQNVNKTVTIDVSNLSNGLYLIKATSEKGISVRKFVKE
jgi:PKD repeat protein